MKSMTLSYCRWWVSFLFLFCLLGRVQAQTPEVQDIPVQTSSSPEITLPTTSVPPPINEKTSETISNPEIPTQTQIDVEKKVPPPSTKALKPEQTNYFGAALVPIRSFADGAPAYNGKDFVTAEIWWGRPWVSDRIMLELHANTGGSISVTGATVEYKPSIGVMAKRFFTLNSYVESTVSLGFWRVQQVLAPKTLNETLTKYPLVWGVGLSIREPNAPFGFELAYQQRGHFSSQVSTADITYHSVILGVVYRF
jgi:hypothetical protein